MPLLDHFVPPLSRTHPWRGFNSAWASAIARHLNRGILPAGYYAIPNVELDTPIEIDVATLQEHQAESGLPDSGTSLWTPPEPALTVALDYTSLELVEVQVLFDEDGPRLSAAIELVSPSNKDRPAERRAFAVKCVSYLHHGSSVIVVDCVTTRRTQLHDEIVGLLKSEEGGWKSPTQLYAVAYHAMKVEEQRRLQVWPEALALGSALPRLPLWLGSDVCVPLDLEATYLATCDDLRIRQAS
jgi:hypothetical protein